MRVQSQRVCRAIFSPKVNPVHLLLMFARQPVTRLRLLNCVKYAGTPSEETELVETADDTDRRAHEVYIRKVT